MRKSKIDYDKLRFACTSILEAIGEDPRRPGLEGTPDRFARHWIEFAAYEDDNHKTVFEAAAVDQLVVVSGMRVWSMCEHHLLPFWCDVSVGYIAGGQQLGLSKFARIAHRQAHRLTTQEALAEGVADEVCDITGTKNVAVIARGEHTCMMMRGIKTGGLMTTSVMRGIFRRQTEPARQEFLTMSLAARGS